MNRTLAIAALAAAFGLAGCTATEHRTDTASKSAGAEEEVVTGSRLPRKSTGVPQKGMSKDDWRLETGRGIGNAPKGG